MEWMLDIQLGRRNLSPIQRIAVAEKYRPIYEKIAKENLSTGGRNGGLTTQNKPLVNLPKTKMIYLILWMTGYGGTVSFL